MTGQAEEERQAWWLAAPGLLLLALFLAGPVALACGASLTDLRLGSPFPCQFVGLRNYRALLGDESFWRALVNTATFAAVVTPVQTGLALAVACSLTEGVPGLRVYRAIFFLPVVFPVALVAVIWEPMFGAALEDARLALGCIVVMSIWQGMGLQTLLLLAGLQTIPQSHYEAAAAEGATPWQTFRLVTLPALRGPLLSTALLTLVLSFRVFDQVQILTRGGPAEATSSVLFLLVRTSFERLQIGRASALAVMFLAIMIALSLLQGARRDE